MIGLIQVKLLVDEKIIIESLTRIGIKDEKRKIIYPTCYLYFIHNSFYILQFKELFLLLKENSYNNILELDLKRRNAIVWNLENWGLVEVINKELIKEHDTFVDVVNFKDKKQYLIKHKINYKYENCKE